MRSSIDTDLEHGSATEKAYEKVETSQDRRMHNGDHGSSIRASHERARPSLPNLGGKSSIASLSRANGEKARASASIHSFGGSVVGGHQPANNGNEDHVDSASVARTEGGPAASVRFSNGGRRSEGNETASWNSARMEHPHSLGAKPSTADFGRTISRGASLKAGHWVVNHHKDGMFLPIKRKKEKNWLGTRKIRSFVRSSNSKPNSRTNGSPGDDENTSFRINLAELQRMYLRKMQCKLANHVVDMRFRDKEPEGWEEDLQAYIKGYQDYEYMVKCSQSLRDPFLITGERKVDDFVIHEALDGLDTNNIGDAIPVQGPWEDENEPIGGTRNEHVAKSWMKNFRDRLVMATIGGILLIAPMWLMVLHNTLYTGLVSTTVFVALFGAVMALILPEPKEVMSGTAAYAAVLVVFVGLNTGSNDTS